MGNILKLNSHWRRVCAAMSERSSAVRGFAYPSSFFEDIDVQHNIGLLGDNVIIHRGVEYFVCENVENCPTED
jgi:hypothetical protein